MKPDAGGGEAGVEDESRREAWRERRLEERRSGLGEERGSWPAKGRAFIAGAEAVAAAGASDTASASRRGVEAELKRKVEPVFLNHPALFLRQNSSLSSFIHCRSLQNSSSFFPTFFFLLPRTH